MRRLLIRPGAIGDCLTCLPVMQALRAGYTEVWVPSALVPIMAFADRARSLADTGIDLLGMCEPQRPLRDTLASFDSIVSWYGASRTDFRIAAEELNPHWQFFPALPPNDGNEHATDFFARIAGVPAGMKAALKFQRAAPSRDTIVIHPFSGSPRKNWPRKRFLELSQRAPLPVEWLVGPQEEFPDAHRFTDLVEAAEWIRGARLFIGNDSGISHLAAATGVCTLVLFGVTNPNIWAPRGECVHIVQRESLRSIGVDDVAAEINRLLGLRRLLVSNAE